MNCRRFKTLMILLFAWFLSLSLIRPTQAQIPLPPDIKIVTPGVNVSAQTAKFSGVWAGGAWDGILPHCLIVENVSAGKESVIYSYGDAPDWNTKANFYRVEAVIGNGRLSFSLKTGANVEYVINDRNGLNGTYTRGRSVSKVFLKKTTLEKLNSFAPTLAIALNEETLRIPVKYSGPLGSVKELRLEATLFRPNQTGRVPVVVFNHGSTGPGLIPVDQTQKYPILARYFVEKGFAFLAPMRRGRGKSEGDYLEGYQCGSEESGINSAVEDLEGVFIFLKGQPWADINKALIGGVSRGGILSVIYAGRRPEMVKGVINFVGGWMSERCFPDSNGRFFAEAAKKAKLPMLWLYAENDNYYSSSSINNYRDSFEKAGGKGPFHLYKDIGGNGHNLPSKPLFWRPALDEYLKHLGFDITKKL